ncbi:putative F-box domain-containing protein [Medicago truncatula]|uniref:F-box protein interaction domain protein n=1 Tax=Medicago truncatula TaxID=3880 RepID=G7IEK7_MEDTR|nr:F-box/kelch-repeat protein At3g23880 [Medicago truncatula]AES61738.2 F-box protein interaction domain protein [Medicago truncatula]RHN81082.1 putative F-box domain-containing protein [Medicago truncatula]
MTTTPSPLFFSDDLLTEILSLLPVKSLLRFKCVSNPWKTLISDPNFVKFHFKKLKSRNPQHFTLITEYPDNDYSIIPYPIPRILDNPSFTLVADPHFLLSQKDCSRLVGSCNGLVCLVGDRYAYGSGLASCYEYWFRLWNPATRKTSQKIGCFCDSGIFVFDFGCDNSTETFKVVASRYLGVGEELTTDVRVFSLGDNVWRNIESFPVVPLYCDVEQFHHTGVFLNGTLNWLAIQDEDPITHYCDLEWNNIKVEQIVIVSLDLGTETYNQYRLPWGFDEVPSAEPSFGVLGDCLCFSYCYRKTDFIIWQMKEFGVEESWTQFLKISYHDLQLNYDSGFGTLQKILEPLFLSNDGDTLSRSFEERESIIYNWRDHRVERTGVTVHKTSIDDGNKGRVWWSFAKGFVESLISIS